MIIFLDYFWGLLHKEDSGTLGCAGWIVFIQGRVDRIVRAQSSRCSIRRIVSAQEVACYSLSSSFFLVSVHTPTAVGAFQ